MKHLFSWIAIILLAPLCLAQVAINNTGTPPNASAMLEVSSTTRGLLVPRMTMAQRNAIAGPATGLMIFQTDNTPGYYFNSGSTTTPQWAKMAAAGDPGLGFALPYSGTYTGDVAFSIENAGNTAIRGISSINLGRGVEGRASGGGEIGVFGWSYGSTPYGIGVFGQADNTSGTGVLGRTLLQTGLTTGVKGESYSSGGIGVYGQNTSNTGSGIGVLGQVSSPEGYSGQFVGGKFYILGNTGIGTLTPHAGLHVKGADWPNSFLYLESDEGQDAGIRFYEGANPKWHFYNLGGGNGLLLHNNLGEIALFARQENAFVGIGTSTPAAKLDVNGQIKISGGSPGAGKVLTSDASGLASWQTPSAGLVLPYQGTVTANEAFTIFNENGGNAVHGISSGITGIGVVGESHNFGVLGKALYTEGPNWGVSGESASSGGRGVYGKATSYNGYSIGVLGESQSADGIGVMGEAKSMTGKTYGVRGVAGSPTGTGVYGWGGTKGVFGETQTGFGVYGNATGTTGTNYGVYGNSDANAGVGVLGRASASTGVTYGVFGQGNSAGGAGVYGLGTGIGVKGEAGNADGFSGWFNIGKFFVNGRVGLGTTSPGAGLHLKATGYPNSFMFIEAADNQDAGIRLYEGTLDQWHIFNSAGADGLHIYNRAGATVFFARQTNGFVGIGNTAPTQMLDVAGTIRVRGMSTGVVAGTVSRTADGTLITGASDIRLKENIEPLQHSLDRVLQLRGVSFNWKADPQKRVSIGFVAQDFEKVIPELVFTNDNDGLKGINYSEVTAVLVDAVKELKKENDNLRARLEKVENRKQ